MHAVVIYVTLVPVTLLLQAFANAFHNAIVIIARGETQFCSPLIAGKIEIPRPMFFRNHSLTAVAVAQAL